MTDQSVTHDTLLALQRRIQELENSSAREQPRQAPSGTSHATVSVTDKRFQFATYENNLIDDITKANARMTYDAYKKLHPSATPQEHFLCLVHYGAQHRMTATEFCDLASTLYGATTRFLYNNTTRTFNCPADFYNNCITVGDVVPPVTALRARLLTLQHAMRTSDKQSLEDYIAQFFIIISDLARHHAGRLYSSPHAVNLEFINGFPRHFRQLWDKEAHNVDLGDPTEVIGKTKQLWAVHNRDARTQGHEHPRQHRVLAHSALVKRKDPSGPSDEWLALTAEQRTALKALHQRMRTDPFEPTTKDIALLTACKACHLCGTLNHSTEVCPKSSKKRFTPTAHTA